MVVSTVNRMARGMDYPQLVGKPSIVTLVTDLEAPGTDYVNKSYGMAGLGTLGTVLDDITSGNWSALPTDIISGLTSGDIGSYLIVGGLAYLLIGGFGSSKKKSRRLSRKAALKGQIAQDQTLLSGS